MRGRNSTGGYVVAILIGILFTVIGSIMINSKMSTIDDSTFVTGNITDEYGCHEEKKETTKNNGHRRTTTKKVCYVHFDYTIDGVQYRGGSEGSSSDLWKPGGTISLIVSKKNPHEYIFLLDVMAFSLFILFGLIALGLGGYGVYRRARGLEV